MSDDQQIPAHSLPIIRGEHIYMRPPDRGDLERFVRWFADAEVTQNLAARAPFSLAMEEKWFERVIAEQGKSQYHFVICLLDGGRPIGTAGFHDLDFEDGEAEFGIAIDEKDEWNKGYGTDALNAICDFGFGELRLERIELDVYAGNDRAQRSYQKAGFQLEGTFRHAHFHHGRYVDVHRMALLRDEWLALDRRRSWDYS
jgi:RimJ/RimL family protein N-acetyltransferase